MKATPLAIPEVILLEPRVFGDDRGFFFESYNRQAFREATGVDPDFVQDNHSRSAKGVLRGLHYQLPPKAQGKLVRVTLGEVFDVAVDIRPDSATFGKWVGEVLSAEVQSNCPYSAENQRTVEAAVKKASPLPLKGNEDLRLRDFVVNFYPSR